MIMQKVRLAVLSTVAAGVLAAGVGAVPAQAATPTTSAATTIAAATSTGTASAGSTAPANAVLPLSSVAGLFSEVTQLVSVGPDPTAVGHPTSTVSLVFADPSGTKRVTLSIDLYASAADSAAAFQQSAQASTAVPGFTPLQTPALGDASTAGIVTMGTETHVGIGVLDGQLIVGATTAGFSLTQANTDRLVTVAQLESTIAKAVMGAAGS
ncbi:hypothetical protein [Kitasatospora sp. NBC_01302]|uniref:hypothetical protein n=1 Tax=Kitasatospora sp. NBC_01302 TaxID=2903575 RepID=UPI002E0DADE2|nr:hypothetical protein OG294_02780 [Kitasatospora sp. NBC_01302]